jgi:hypothetical protein
VLPNAQIELVFWGSGWTRPLAATVQNDINSIIAGPYLGSLSQYGPIRSPAIVGASFVNDPAPASVTSPDAVNTMLQDSLTNGAIPPPNTDPITGNPNTLYMVLTQPGTTGQDDSTGQGIGGSHHFDTFNGTKFYFGWAINPDVNTLTNKFSHELVEALTDPEGNATTLDDPINQPDPVPDPGPDGNDLELCDGQQFTYRLNGVEVESYWSQVDNHFIVPDGQVQDFFVLGDDQNNSTGALVVNGDQFGSGFNDMITIDETSSGGVEVTMNGDAVQFDLGQINLIDVNPGGGTDTINVVATPPGVSLAIDCEGSDTVNVGRNGYGQAIQGNVVVGGNSVFTQLRVDDSKDTAPRSSVLLTNSSLQGLTPGEIEFAQGTIDSLTILDGSGGTVYGVESTPDQPDFFARTTTTLIIQGRDTVQVGDSNETTAGISGNLTITNPQGSTLLSVDDGNDHTVGETVTVTSTTLTGLTGGTIDYGGAALQSLSVFAGDGGTTFNVLSTPVLVVNAAVTELESHGQDTVNVGNSGSVQAIHSGLDVFNVGGATVLSVDDSGDGTTRVVTLQNAGSHNSVPDITGLSPGAIAYLGVRQLNVGTGRNFNIISVEGTSTCTLLTTQANDLVEVGDFGSTQGIQGSLFVRNRGAGKTGLIVDDSADTTARAVVLNYNQFAPELIVGRLTGLTPAPISFPGSGLESIQLETGGAANNVTVLATRSLVELEQNGGTETIDVGKNGLVEGTQGGLVIGTEIGFRTPATQLVVDDSADPRPRTVTFDGTAFPSINGLLVGPISYPPQIVQSVTFNGGSAGNVFDVHATPKGTVITINTGAGSDTVNVGSTSNALDDIQGPLTVNGQGGVNQFVVNDGGSSTGDTYTLSSTELKRSGAATIIFSSMQNLTVDAGTGSNTFIVSSSPSGAGVALNGGAGDNTLITNDGDHTIRITGHNVGSYDNITFSNVASLVGGTGSDVFAFTPAGVLDGTIDGGGGSDWLDYSSFTTGVKVNLVTGSATNVRGGVERSVTGIRNVRGGSGSDMLIGGGGNILVGGGGHDTLVDKFTGSAASGRSLLIGGAGGDTLTAGAAGDILIGGTTIFDDNDAALTAILAEWQSSDSYNTRFDRLEGRESGGLNGSVHLIAGTTVKEDGRSDVLNGGAGFDWYFARLSGGEVDTIHGRNKPGHEHVNNTI